MSENFISLTRPAEPSTSINGNILQNLTAEQIFAKIQADFGSIKLQNDEILAITTPLYREILKPGDVPTKMYPGLFQMDREGKFKRPNYYLTILPKNMEKLFTIFVKVKTDDKLSIPPFEVVFDPQKLSADYLLEETKQQFQHELVKAKLKLEKQNNLSNISIKLLKQQQLTFLCSITEKAKGRIKHRMKIINEIQKTEQTYIQGLECLLNKWKPALINEKLLTPDEFNTVVNNIPTILQCHETFYKSIMERGDSYGAMLSDVFLDFSSFFKTSLHYISNYSNSIQIISRKSDNKDWDSRVNLLGEQIGNPFTSLLITPVQRMPRYNLFLKELIKYTPSSHPDYVLLEASAEKMKAITAEIDEASAKAENNGKLIMIQKCLDKYVILSPSRKLEQEYQITIEKPTKSKGMLYFFNDLILVTTIESKSSQKVLYNAIPIAFRYASCPTNESIQLFLKTKTKNSQLVFTFAKQEDKDEFVQNFTNILDTQFYNEPIENMLLFKLLKTDINLPAVSGNDCCFINNKLYSYCRNYLFTLNINTGEVKPISIKNSSFRLPSSFHGQTMTSINENTNDPSIIIFGGKNDAEPLNDLYQYRINANVFEKMENENKPEPRYGHTTIFYEGKLIVFGGYSRKKKLLNDVCVYDMYEGRWSGNYSLHDSPSPRAYHSAVVYHKKMYIYGGVGEKNKDMNDMYELDLVDFKWYKVPLIDLPSRSGHQSLMIGSEMLTIGGVYQRHIAAPIVIKGLGTQEPKVVVAKVGYNDPPTLLKFAMAYYRDEAKKSNKVIIYGGEYPRSKRDKTNGVFIVEVPEIHEQSNEINKVNMSPIMRRSIGRMRSIPSLKEALDASQLKNISGNINSKKTNEEEDDSQYYSDDELLQEFDISQNDNDESTETSSQRKPASMIPRAPLRVATKTIPTVETGISEGREKRPRVPYEAESKSDDEQEMLNKNPKMIKPTTLQPTKRRKSHDRSAYNEKHTRRPPPPLPTSIEVNNLAPKPRNLARHPTHPPKLSDSDDSN